jgi:hypothetical protein
VPTTYRIHPAIGIARLGNSPDAFCISPEEPAALPVACDARGNPLLGLDGTTAKRVEAFKDGDGRIKRQAARFQIYVYDEKNPEGRPLQIGDPIEGGGNDGVLQDIQWRVHLANKKSSWYQFKQAEGEHGYAPDHPRRNADITAPEARQRLIIDPGPRIVDLTARRTASFDRETSEAVYAPTFPPPLKPAPVDTLGELKTDDSGRLLVLGGHGHSGSYLYDEFGQPRIDDYANNDGWFDDTSDGPVMARLVMFSERVGRVRFVDVEYPEILDMITVDEVIEDVGIQQFATRPDLYGIAGTFASPKYVDPSDSGALQLWRASRLQWNPEYRPWFYRDIWPILFRPDQFSYLSNVLGQSNFPHNQSGRGNFDPKRLGVPPMVDRERADACEEKCLARHRSGELFLEPLAPVLLTLEREAPADEARRAPLRAAMSPRDRESAQNQVMGGREAAKQLRALRSGDPASRLRDALAAFAARAVADESIDRIAPYLEQWRTAGDRPETAVAHAQAKDDLSKAVDAALAPFVAEDSPVRIAVRGHLRKYFNGTLLEDCRLRCLAANTADPYRPERTFLYDLLRAAGQENQFAVGGPVTTRVYGLPLMPLLAGDNPISNTLPSKFLRLTDYQYYLLQQWARGLFFNEELEGWGVADPFNPYAGWVNRTGHDLDRGVLTNLLGGAFCPGGEIGWIIRNSAIYKEPYRIKADPDFYTFSETAAQANAWSGSLPESDYVSYTATDLSQDDDFDRGLQPGDLTKHMALPWQSDFNECSTQVIDVTYDGWNQIFPQNNDDSQMAREQRVWETLWWPAHRPLQSYEITSMTATGPAGYQWVDWSRGVPQTNAGDLKMVTEWWRLGFVRKNPYTGTPDVLPSEVPPPSPPPYISVERTPRKKNETGT